MIHGAIRMDALAQPPTRVGQVMAAVRQRIAGRGLTQGEKLPSIRRMAGLAGVSASTVVEAYDRLVAEGEIVSRPGSGFIVAGRASPLSLADVGPRLDRAVDPLWISRQSLDAGDGGLKPGCGWLPDSWMPLDGIRRAMRALARADGPVLTDYGSPLGLPALRGLISRRLGERGVEAAPEQIVLTDSDTQAIDLVCRLLIEPGETVLVDDPCYFNFQALLRAHRVRIVSVPYGPQGPDPQAFARVLEDCRPRLYVTNSGIHNPTGASLSPATAHKILRLADQFALTIVEDDIFADFERTPAPRLAAFDGLARVVQIGSFSKTLSAAARCGFIAARAEWIEGLVDLKIATGFGGGRLTAELVHGVLGDGLYRRHLHTLRNRLSRAMAETAARLRALGIEPWTEPRDGMFLWCRLPDGADATEIARAALVEGVVLAPGNAFSAAQAAASFMRFNVAQCTDARIFDVLERALAGAQPARP
ncbi:MAG: PLP-dependent aminotransferase family protein [Rhizobiaceae bacterium]|nr:PLP-dependent aminotransferase family protein [Rhizobiaceae bacterium]